MQQRKIVFATNEIYHVYNRSIAKAEIFTTLSHLNKIFETITYYRYPQTLKFSQFQILTDQQKHDYLSVVYRKTQLIEIYAFSFMPNHFHLLLKQKVDNGIKLFISIMQNSYAKYFNKRYDRQGGLFQSPFQGARIETDEQFIHVSRYIHLNHVTSYITPPDQLITHPYASFYDYIQENRFSWLTTRPLLSFFPTKEGYKKFVLDQADYQKKISELKHLSID